VIAQPCLLATVVAQLSAKRQSLKILDVLVLAAVKQRRVKVRQALTVSANLLAPLTVCMALTG
jgi:hypothetical protein